MPFGLQPVDEKRKVDLGADRAVFLRVAFQRRKLEEELAWFDRHLFGKEGSAANHATDARGRQDPDGGARLAPSATSDPASDRWP